MAEKKPAEISSEIQAKYKMKRGFAPGKYYHKSVEIDLSNCSLEEADKAFKDGLAVIEEIKPTEPVKAVEKKL